MAFLSQATSSWRLASSSRLPFRSMLLTLRGGPESLAPRAHQIPVSLMVFSTFLCRAFTAHEALMVQPLFAGSLGQGQRIADLAVQHRVLTISTYPRFA